MFCYKLSNTVELFNADGFAEWMKKHWADSKWKNYKDFAAEIKSNPATISRLMNGAPQTLTDKASQPKPDLVKRIAEAFGADVDEALNLAGHAPLKPQIGGVILRDWEKLSEKARLKKIKEFEAQIQVEIDYSDDKNFDYISDENN